MPRANRPKPKTVGKSPRATKLRKLTKLQERFVPEYLVDLNASAAIRRAGYIGKNSDARGYQILQSPSVKAALAAAYTKRATVSEITRGRIMEEYSRAAFANVAAPVGWSDKRAALQDLGKAIGMFDEKGPAVTVNVSMNDANAVAAELSRRIAGIASRVGPGCVPSIPDAGGIGGSPVELAPLLGKTEPDSSSG